MNDQEFDTFRRRLSAMFPDLANWFVGLDGKGESGAANSDQTRRNAVRGRWRSALANTDLSDALAALEDIGNRPDDPWEYPSQKERAGAIVASEASKIAAARRQADQADRFRASRRRKPVDIQGLRADLFGRIDADQRHDEECRQHRSAYGRCRSGCPVPSLVAAEICAEPCDLPTDRESYRCVLCRDMGLVFVLTGEAVRETAEAGCVRPGPRQGISLACSCDGQAARTYRASRLANGEAFFYAFNPEKHVPEDLPAEALVSACRAVVESLGGRKIQAFVEWNRRAV